MSGLFTIAARLSNGEVVSTKTFKGSYLGARTLTDEAYFLKLYKTYLGGSLNRLQPQNEEDAIEQYNKYEMGESLVSPYHYGICFIDFIEKTIDYYSIDGRFNFIHKNMMEFEIRQFFQSHYEKFNKENKNGRKTLQDILDEDMNHVVLANFIYAKEKGWLKKLVVNENRGVYGEDYSFKLNDFLNFALKNGEDFFPEIFICDIQGWKIQDNKHDIDLQKFEEIKESLNKKSILNKYDLLGWKLYKEKVFFNSN